MEVFVHDIKNVRSCSFKTTCKDTWSADQMSAWKKIKDNGFEIIYQGPDKDKEITSPFFEMDENYVGIKCDVGFSCIANNSLIVMPLQDIKSPPVIPLIYEIDKWCLEITLLFKNEEFTIKNGDSLAYCLVANIEPNKLIQKNLTKEREQLQNKKFFTRNNNFTNEQLDNYYEIVTKNNKPLFPKTKIFQRKYEQNA